MQGKSADEWIVVVYLWLLPEGLEVRLFMMLISSPRGKVYGRVNGRGFVRILMASALAVLSHCRKRTGLLQCQVVETGVEVGIVWIWHVAKITC